MSDPSSDTQKRAQADLRSEFMASASAALASSLDYEQTLSTVARLAVPKLGDWCVVDVADENGYLRRLAATHVDPEKIALAQELGRRYPEKPDLEFGIQHTFRTGKAELIPEVTEDLLRIAAYSEEHFSILKELGLTSYLCVPMQANGRNVGVISLISANPGHRYGDRDLELAQELGTRAALAIENARLYHEASESAEWLSTILRSIGDAVIATDKNGAVKFLNPIAEQLTGWTLTEAAGRPVTTVFQIVDEVTGAPMESPVEKALSTGKVVELTRRADLITKDGRRAAIEDSAAPIRNSAGKIIGAVMVFHDVTERRQKELALEKSEQRFRLLGEIVPQLIWTTDAAGRREYLNERWFDYIGRSAEWTWASIVHPDDYERSMREWMLAVETGTPLETEFRLRRHDGEYRWFVSRGVPLHDENGKIVRWYGSCTDIHQQKLTTEALHEEYTITEQLHEVATALATELDLSKVVQIITDAGTRITRAQFGAFFYNLIDEKGATYMLYTLSGVPREAFDKFPMPRATHLFGPTFRGEGVIRADDIRKDPRFGKNPPHHGMPAGHLPVVSYLAVPVISRSGEVIGGLFFGHSEAGVFTDRDEKIIVGVAAQAAAAMDVARLYQREQQARALAEQASQAKDHFLAALSHELRTPLTPVIAILSSLQQEEAIPEPLIKDIETVRRNVELEARLIDDLLDLTRITRGKLELHCNDVAIGRLIDDAINTCLPDIKAKRLNLVRELDEVDQILNVDPARVTQILWNLVKNAVKFTPANGTITIRSRVACENTDTAVVVEVKDSGIGINADRLEYVFDAFEQGDRKITRQFGGLGLGLAISKAIAESHHGTLSATSDGPGSGATFTLRLPLDGCRDDSEIPSRTPGKNVTSPTVSDRDRDEPVNRSLRILLVEDHADTAAILVRLLERMGHSVIHADTIARALETAHREMKSVGIDFVMSDLGLPDGSGLDLMRELSSTYGLRGIALSGFGMDSDLEQSLAAGFFKHLIKPIDITVLKSTIANLFQGNASAS